jgi:hypothetical protein
MGKGVVPVLDRIANAAFIAACAGAAEAGWRSTIAAIDLILKIGWTEGEICKGILTAWEGQL